MRCGFVHVTLPKDEHVALKEIAAQRGETLSELIRTFIVWGTEELERDTTHKVGAAAPRDVRLLRDSHRALDRVHSVST